MKTQVSPFAALTGEEKQLKWLEYQSIRLPYTETAVEKPEAPAPGCFRRRTPAEQRNRNAVRSRPAGAGETDGKDFWPFHLLF